MCIRDRLYALNYGDWGLEGVEFTYIMPRGVRPKYSGVEELKKHITARILSSVTGPGNEAYDEIDPENIEVEILQTPDKDAGYLAPDAAQDPIWNTETDDSYYPNGQNAKDAQPWVLKIV